MINVQNVSKTFILHQQNGVRLPVLQGASLTVNAGECVVLHGHSGSGKSTLLRSLYANYLPDEGQIQIKHGDEWVDLVTAPARKVVEIREAKARGTAIVGIFHDETVREQVADRLHPMGVSS